MIEDTSSLSPIEILARRLATLTDTLGNAMIRIEALEYQVIRNMSVSTRLDSLEKSLPQAIDFAALSNDVVGIDLRLERLERELAARKDDGTP